MRSSLSTAPTAAPAWELTLPDDASGTPLRRTIWRSEGGADLCDITVLSALLPQSLSETALSDIAVQVLLRAPPRIVTQLLSSLACSYCRGSVMRRDRVTGRLEELNVIDGARLTTLSSAQRKAVCGQVFKRGDLVWTCRECAKDATCVQCDACFRRSEHRGHEVYFHRASGDSGCCDCGDAEAWAAQGNCSEHGCARCESERGSGSGSGAADPASAVPQNLQRGLRAVLRALLAVAAQLAVLAVRGYEDLPQNLILEALRNPLYDLASFASRYERERERESENGERERERDRARVAVLRVHNDDVHTFQEVTAALQRAGLSARDAARLTDLVDKVGGASAGVFRLPAEEAALRTAWSALRGAGLLVSIAPQWAVAREEPLCAALQWALSLGQGSDALRRVVVEELLCGPGEPLWAAVHALSVCAVPLSTAAPSLSPSLWRLSDAFAHGAQFPSEVSQLRDVQSLSLSLSARCVVEVSGGDSATSPSYSEVRESESDAAEREMRTRVVRPFRTVQVTLLGLLTLASPFLSLPLQLFLHSLVMHFQHDALFKTAFSQTITCLYPSLCMLYCVKHIGVSAHSLFRTTVQLYTAHSVVRLLSSPGELAGERLLREGVCESALSLCSREIEGERARVYVTVTGMLGNVLYTVLRALGLAERDLSAERAREARRGARIESAVEDEANDHEDEALNAFLHHHAVRTNRVSIVCRDVEYLLSGQALFCVRLLRGETNAGTVEAWLDVCRLAQELDKHKRHTARHVERESDAWSFAANLALEIETATAQLVTAALLDDSVAAMDSEFHSLSLSLSQRDAARPQSLSVSLAERERGEESLSFDELQSLRAGAVDTVARKAVQRLQSLYSQSYCDREADRPVTLDTRSLTLCVLPFAVSRDFVSIHLPLHRMLYKTLYCAAQGGVALHGVLSQFLSLSLSGADKRMLVDLPLRCLVFAAQCDAGLWVRNGGAAANMAFNYQRAPLCRAMRDLDVFALQCAMRTAALETTSSSVMHNTAVDRVLLFVLERFEVLSHIEAQRLPAREAARESGAALLGDALRLLIHALTRLPSALVAPGGAAQGAAEEVEGVHRALCREIVHQYLCAPRATTHSLSSFARAKAMVGAHRTVSDAALARAVHAVCAPAGAAYTGEREEGAALALREDAFRLADPEHAHLSRKDGVALHDRLRERFAQLTPSHIEKLHESTPYAGNPYVPLVFSDALPVPHWDFLTLREALSGPCLCEIMLRVLRVAGHETASQKGCRDALAGRVVHLVTLQIHCHALAVARLARVSAGEDHHSTPAYNAAEAHVKALSLSALYCESNATGFALLRQLADLWQRGVFGEDPVYRHGLGFALHHIACASTDAERLLASVGFVVQRLPSGTSSEESEESARRKARKDAQERAMAAARERAAAALSAFSAELSSSDDESEGETEREGDLEEKRNALLSDKNAFLRGSECVGAFRRLDRETCIVCRERDGRPIGLLALLQCSTVAKNAVLRQQCGTAPVLRKLQRCVVTAGCVVRAEPSHASQCVGSVAYGETVVVEQRRGLWVCLSAPLSGWVCVVERRSAAQNALSQLPATGVHPAVRHSHTVSRTLHPVLDLTFNRNGGTRVHVNSCGHAMHTDCWDALHSAAFSRALNGPAAAETIAFDARRGECVCPLCKAVCNALLPLPQQPPQPLQCGESGAQAAQSAAEDAESDTERETSGDDDEPLCVSVPPPPGPLRPLSTLLPTHTQSAQQSPLSVASQEEESALCGLAAALLDRVRPRPSRVSRSSHAADTRMHGALLTLHGALNALQRNAVSGALTLRDWDARCGGNVRAARAVHVTASAAAYSLCALGYRQLRLFAEQDKTPGEDDIARNDALSSLASWRCAESDSATARLLLGLTARSLNTFSRAHGERDRARLLCAPLLARLCGVEPYDVLRQAGQGLAPSVADEATLCLWRHRLRSLPWHAVHSADYPDWPTVLEALHGAAQACGSRCAAEMSGFAAAPLLSQDLSLWAVLCVALFPSESERERETVRDTFEEVQEGVANDRQGVESDVFAGGALRTSSSLLVAAKVVQSLLEPAATGLSGQLARDGLSPSKRQKTEKPEDIATNSALPHAPTDTLCVALRDWQRELCGAADTPLFAAHCAPTQLLRHVLDSALPLLDLLCRLHDWTDAPLNYASLCGVRAAFRAANRGADDLHAMSEIVTLMLRALGVADSLEALLCAPWARSLGVHWARDLATTHATHPSVEREICWVPDAHTHSHTPSQSSASHSLNAPTQAAPHRERERDSESESDSMFADDREGELVGNLEDFADDREGSPFPGLVFAEDDEDEDIDINDLDTRLEAFAEDAEGVDRDFLGVFADAPTHPPHVEQLLRTLRTLLLERGVTADEVQIPQEIRALLDENIQRDREREREPAAEGETQREGESDEPLWRQYGVLPAHALLDELSLEHYAAALPLLSTTQGGAVSLSPTPMCGSLTGSAGVLGLRGAPLACVWPDWSHLSLPLSAVTQSWLVSLPALYTDLYSSAKFPEGPRGVTIDDPALCLVCGEVLNAGGRAKSGVTASAANPGECSLHCARCGAGTGVFLLVHSCTALLVRDGRAVYYSSALYLDAAGQSPSSHSGFAQQKPLFLSAQRYRKLEELYRQHLVAREVVTQRLSADSVIRAFWH